MAEFEATVTIGSTAAAAFDFLVRPANLMQITPAEAGLKLVSAPERLSLGSKLEFEMSGYGPTTQRMHYEIVEFDEPRRFVERQIKGPLKRYEHEHFIEPLADGSIVVTDKLIFEPPGGLLRFVVTEERVMTSLSKALEYRQRKMKRLLERAANKQASGDA
ncbi:MAG: SRPBCC family protein [Planctomycetaceae bacterium]